MSRTTTHPTFVNNGRSSPVSPSWSDSSSSSEHDEPSSPKRSSYSSNSSSTTSRRGPGGRGGGGNNASGVKGPRWNEERKTMVLERFLQPFVTRELYRLDLQAALEAFIIEQEWDDAPMKDMVTRIKRLLTNARDINKKKAARGGGASTAKSTSLSQQKKKDVAVKVEKKAKVVSASKAKKTAAPLPTPTTTTTTTTPAPVQLVAATVVVKAEVPAPIVRPIAYKPKMVVDASPLASLSNVAAAVAQRQSFGLVPPPISIPSLMMAPWSPSQSSVSSANDSISDASDVDESADGEANPLLAFLHGAPCTPLPSSIAVATPVLSLASSNTSTYSEDDVDSVDVSYDYCSLPFSFDGEAPLPMLPSLPSLMVPLTPRISAPVLSSLSADKNQVVDSGVDAVDAAPMAAAVYQYVPGTGMVLSVQAPAY